MANTPSFNWETPDDTDLVKDGALAIRTLGNAIDASMTDLKGGTTGQVLSKTSNTDMDFTWVTSDDANAIQNAIVDAKGDLIAASAADTPARLAVGNNGETLVADSSATTGLRWQGSQAGGRNAIINGGMDFWQRGTSFTSASVYTADRWFKGSQAGCTVSRQTASLEGFQYSMRVQRDSGTTNVNGMGVYHNIETQESLRFAGKTIVISFYAKAGANYSPTSSLLNYIVYTGTGTDQARTQSVAFTGEAQPASGTVTLTTSWQRFSFTANIASTATEICFVPYMANTGTAGANDWFEITGVQLQLGSVATVFSRAGGTLAGELAACQRYYYRSTPNLNYGTHASGMGEGTGSAQIIFPVPVQMRTTVSSVEYANLRLQDTVNGYTVTNVVLLNSGGQFQICLRVSVASGLTLYRPYVLDNNNNSAGYLAVSAEL